MLNGDAHHSLMWVVEPRIWPLLNCQRRLHRKRQGSRRKQKNRNLGWPLVKGAKESADVGSPDLLRGLWGIQPRFIRDSPVRVVIDPIPPQLGHKCRHKLRQNRRFCTGIPVAQCADNSAEAFSPAAKGVTAKCQCRTIPSKILSTIASTIP